MTEQIDPKQYGYKEDQMTLIPAHYLTDLMNILQDVIESQPTIGALYVYPESVENIKDENGNLIESKVNWQPFDEHTGAQAFFKASATPLPLTTKIGVVSERAYMALLKIHESNINAGVAIKAEDLEVDQKMFEANGK